MTERTSAPAHGGVAEAEHADLEHGHDTTIEHPHPGNAEYVRVAIALAFITAIEVAIYYFDVNKLTLVAALLVMSAAKFGLVAAFFMHLKFDTKLFSTFFVGALVMAIAAFIAVLAMFRAF